MPGLTIEAPAKTRELIVDTLIKELVAENERAEASLRRERADFEDPSEPDRSAQALYRLEVGKAMQQYEVTISYNRAFIAWLRRQTCNSSYPLAVGNFLLIELGEGEIIWLVYDSELQPQVDVVVTLDTPPIKDRLGAQEVTTLSTKCPLYGFLKDKTIRVGADISVGVEGNTPVVARLIAIL